jgi:hypothetical protein
MPGNPITRGGRGFSISEEGIHLRYEASCEPHVFDPIEHIRVFIVGVRRIQQAIDVARVVVGKEVVAARACGTQDANTFGGGWEAELTDQRVHVRRAALVRRET